MSQWYELELSFSSSIETTNPYTDQSVWVDITHQSGGSRTFPRNSPPKLRRPAFWDGGDVWRVRFAPPWTGHFGEHIPERVADLWHSQPPKAVANGEPTYERMGHPDRAVGWWQGHEAWCNLCAGGTMGVVYGAASLWQWRHSPDEPGWENWCVARDAGWREALDFEGSNYVGLIAKVLDGLPLTDMELNWDCSIGGRDLLVPGKLMIKYLEFGGGFAIHSDRVPRTYRIIDPRTGETVHRGELPANGNHPWIDSDATDPRVVIFAD